MQTTVSMNLSRVRYARHVESFSCSNIHAIFSAGAAGTWPEMEDMSEYVRRSQ